MTKTYKILSLLLSYPSEELKVFLPGAMIELSKEALLPKNILSGLSAFAKYYQKEDITVWQANYVQLFDFSRAVSLHLFEHVKGDSKDRGQAMVDLICFYRDHGLDISTNELPDYLPVFLEFLSSVPPAKAATYLANIVNVAAGIFEKLQEKDNLYQHILAAVISLSSESPQMDKVTRMINAQKPLDFDKEYADEPVTFGGTNNCTNCQK